MIAREMNWDRGFRQPTELKCAVSDVRGTAGLRVRCVLEGSLGKASEIHEHSSTFFAVASTLINNVLASTLIMHVMF